MKHTHTFIFRLLGAILTFILLFSFCACRAKQSAPPSPQPDPADTSEKDSNHTSLNTQGASGILSLDINDRGELVVTYTDGSQENLGKVVGNDGKDGSNGIDGKDGTNGVDGANGKDGKNGKDGVDGLDGTLVIESEDSSVAAAAALGMRSAVCIISAFSETDKSAGSGVIYQLDRAEGNAIILTNYHVVYSSISRKISDDISLYLYGSYLLESKKITASYIGGSAEQDIAVLQIRDSDVLRQSSALAVTVADSDALRPGDTAIAIGNPESSGFSVTSGIVSVDAESITLPDSGNTATVIRIDTPVNGGNSGGGLFNSQGELIGIVNAKIIDEEVDNIGFAIPSNIALAVAENLLDNCLNQDSKTLKKYTLGITILLTNAKNVYNSSDGTLSLIETISVNSINSDSHCQGILEKDDVILSFTLNGVTTPITRMHQITSVLLNVREGDTLSVTVLRNGEEKTFSLSTDVSCFS